MYENSFTFTKMLAAYAKPLRFTGRSTRTEVLGYLIVTWVIGATIQWAMVIGGIAASISEELALISLLGLNILLWLPFPALAFRRFHDQDRPGWLGLALIVPTIVPGWFGPDLLPLAVNQLLVMIYIAVLILLFWKPTDGTNRYGPDPRLGDSLEEGSEQAAVTE